MCFQMHANLFEFYLEFLWSKNYEIVGSLLLLIRSSGKNFRASACVVFKLQNFLLLISGSCVNFHNFSIDPVKVKFGECYSYTIRMLGKMGNLLLDTF